MNLYRLRCGQCNQELCDPTDLLSVLGGTASAIMDHFALGFNWKDLYEQAMKDIFQFKAVFDDLNPLLCTSARELLRHIERNHLHEDGARKIPLCWCANVNSDFDSNDAKILESRNEVTQEFENAMKMSVMCASDESGDEVIHYMNNALIHAPVYLAGNETFFKREQSVSTDTT